MYEILESKLNTMSVHELEMKDPNTFSVIINKLLNISTIATQDQLNAVNALANKLSCIDDKKPVYKRTGNYVWWSESKKAWIAMRNINGKNIFIKQNQKKEIVEQAYKIFCKEHNLTT